MFSHVIPLSVRYVLMCHVLIGCLSHVSNLLLVGSCHVIFIVCYK